MLRVLFIFVLVALGGGILFLSYDLFNKSFSIETSFRGVPADDSKNEFAATETNSAKENQFQPLEAEIKTNVVPDIKTIVNESIFAGSPQDTQLLNDDARRASSNDDSEDEEKSRLVLDNIQSELSKLPADTKSAPARSVLLQTASTLKLNESNAAAVHEMAVNEMFQPEPNEEDVYEAPVGENQSFDFFLPVLAHEIALKTTEDLDEAVGITVDGVIAHRDPGVRFSLVRQFVARYPEFEYDLKEEFLRNNLGLEYFKSEQLLQPPTQ